MKVLEKGHITDNALEEYSLDHLEEPELEVVEEHILICPTCQDRLQVVDDFIRAFRMAHESTGSVEVRQAPPRTSIVLGDEVFAPEIVAPPRTAPAPAWFQRPVVWVGLACGLALLALIPLLWQAKAPAAAPHPVNLVAQRGGDGVAEAAAGRLALEMDLRGVSGMPVAVEVAALGGQALWSRRFAAAGDSLRAEPEPAFAAGQYWVRVFAASDRVLLREFGLRLR